MSLADLKEYGKRCVEEPDLRKKAKEIGLENIAGQIANAKTLGLTFTEHDFMALTKGVGTTQELTEEQLQAVAGGVLRRDGIELLLTRCRTRVQEAGSPGLGNALSDKGPDAARYILNRILPWT